MQRPALCAMRRTVGIWLAVGWLGYAALPWNAIGGQGFAGFQWLATWPLDVRTAPAAVQLFKHGRLWLLPLAIALALPLLVFRTRIQDRLASWILIVAGLAGLAMLIGIALAIDITGWTWRPLAEILGDLPRRQPGLGYGALAVAAAALMFVCQGLALRGWAKGDMFVAGAIGASIALVGLFTLYPISRLFLRAVLDRDGKHFEVAAE